MSTSGSYDNITTLSTILKDAFALINVVDDAETLSSEMHSYGLRMLNKLMSLLSIHKGLWLVDDVTVTLTPGTASYTIGDGETIDTPKPMQIPHARRYVNSSFEIPMNIDAREDYMGIPNKSLQAPPLSIYYDKRRDNGTVYVWPTGSSSEKTIILTCQRPIQDFDVAADNPDLPKEWVMCIEYMLAVMIAPKYLGGVVPPDLASQADRFLATLVRDDEEKTSIRFQPT